MRTGMVLWKKCCRILALLIAVVWTACGTTSGAAETEKETVSIYFFHNTACGTCDGTKEFRALVEEEISGYKDVCPYELLEYNVFKTGGKDKWDAVSEEYSLENESYIFPVMVVGGMMYTGMSEIREHLYAAYLKAAGVSALYFYRKDCQECLDMELFWKQFPERYQSGGEEYPCRLLNLESRTDNNGDLIRQLFEKYQVPDDDQMVPIVFLKERYLAGQQEIEKNLLSSLEEGGGFLSVEEETGESEDEVMVSESGEVLE